MKLPTNDGHLEIELEEEEDEELLRNSRSRSASLDNEYTPYRLAVNILGGIIGFLVILVIILAIPSKRSVSPHTTIDYTCPSTVAKSLNDVGNAMDYYTSDDKKHMNDSLAELKASPHMDGWGIPYVNVKLLLRPWKEHMFVKNINSGDTIYESACGSGLNLVLTTDILREYNIHNITVYGNDYVSQSVEIANRIWDTNTKAKKGILCQGDSTNLTFVPSNTFDFVYTGYIDPLIDPLNLSSSTSSSKKLKVSIENCFSNDTEKQELAKNEQQLQHDWYASWIQEMIRIAKPGKPIVAESNCESVCKHFREYPKIHDWGGVDKKWWSNAISTYNWNVDPSSLVIQDEKTTKEWKYPRYHVFMRKKEE